MTKEKQVEVVHKIVIKQISPALTLHQYLGVIAFLLAPSYLAWFTGSEPMGWVAFVWSFVFALSLFIGGMFSMIPLSIEEAQAKLDKIKAEIEVCDGSQ